MKRLFSLVYLVIGLVATASGQSGQTGAGKPKLVVGIIVDQMRWDYLRYYDYTFGNDGFRRLLSEGYSCDNTQITYVPTVTAVGHSCVYTGSVPAITGIAGNDFYKDGKRTYCTDDASVQTVGSHTKAGLMSPRNLRVTTMCDAVKIAQDFKAKTIGVSLKDRGAIMPAGHTANAAYWFDNEAGAFITSTYYMKELPGWAADFNKANRQTSDIRYTPKGNTLVADMAIAALNGEQLGRGKTTDFLAVSFSSTDYIGHRYGTRSPQTEEAYRLLDREIAKLLGALDSAVGKGNYLLFLSADHAAAHNAALMQKNGVPAGEWDEPAALNDMNNYLKTLYNTSTPLVKDLIEYRVYLDHEAIKAAGKTVAEVEEALCSHIAADDRVAYAVPFDKVQGLSIPQAIRERIINGYNPKRSGDIQIILQPGYYGFDSGSFHEGTSHGVWCSYDTHIPLIFFGWHVSHGQTAKETHVTDIAATVCSMLHIQSPNGCVGTPIRLK